MRRIFRMPFSRTRLDREIDDELAFHLETRVERLMAAGWSHDAARHEALRQFGNVASVRESMVTLDEARERATRRADVAGELRQDLAYALRTLRRNAGVTAVIVGVLATGVGANTAIFTVVNAVLLRPLPVARPEELVAIGDPSMVNSSGRGTPRTDAFSAPLYRDIRDRNQTFIGVLAAGPAGRVDVRVDRTSGDFEHPRARFVSGNYFSVLDVRALAGRTLDARMDDVPGSSPVVTISHAYWTGRFNADPASIGRTVTINGVKMTIVGVTPPSFTGEVVGDAPDMWLPLSMHDALKPHDKILDDRGAMWLLLLGRLKPGGTLALAKRHIKPLIDASILQSASPRVAKNFLSRPHEYFISSGARGLSQVRDTFAAPLLTLMAGVGLVLCIMCANVANLLFARAIARGREMAVRLALGADRLRLVRQLMTESALLAGLSGGVGLIAAWWGSRGLLALAADGGTIPLDLRIDLPVLGFTMVVAVVAVALFGLAPALHASRVDLASALRANGQSIAAASLGKRGRRAPLGATLMTAQIALSVVLLVGAAMLVRSLRNVELRNTGMDRDHLAMVGVDIEARGYQGARLASVTRDISGRLAALPGVTAVTFSENGIFSGTEWSTEVQVPGFTPRAPSDTVVATDQVGAGYARAIGATIVAGRDIGGIDEDRLPRTALVNEALATFYFPHGSAVGQFLRFDDSVAVEIIGVIADTRDHDLVLAPRRRVYFPLLHSDDPTIGEPSHLQFVIRTAGDPAAMVQLIRRAVSSVDPDLPIGNVNPVATLMRATIRQERLIARVATGFGVIALLLAGIGLYGVMAYAITRRTGEIGLRVALGAQRSEVVAMVLRDALRLVGIGVAIGVPLAVASARLLGAQLHDVPSVDPASLAIAIMVLAASAVVAVTLPAMRASKVSPIAALRAE